MSVRPTIAVRRQPIKRAWVAAALGAVLLVGAVIGVFALFNSSRISTASPPAAQIGGAQRVPSILSLTPMQLATGALGTGYALPPAHPLPSVRSVLAAMGPQTRRYTEANMALTFRQLAAGAAGQP
jgi:hypothetical protein